MKAFISSLLLALLLVPAGSSLYADDASDIKKTVNLLVNTIRYGKTEIASKQLYYPGMARLLMGAYWKKMSPDQQKEMTQGIETIIRKVSFVKGKKMFEHLDAFKVKKPRVTGTSARCKAIVVVYRNYKKKEMIIDFALVKDGGAWKVQDMYSVGESFFKSMHAQQIRPLVRKGGVKAVLKAMKKKIKEVS